MQNSFFKQAKSSLASSANGATSNACKKFLSPIRLPFKALDMDGSDTTPRQNASNMRQPWIKNCCRLKASSRFSPSTCGSIRTIWITIICAWNISRTFGKLSIGTKLMNVCNAPWLLLNNAADIIGLGCFNKWVYVKPNFIVLFCRQTFRIHQQPKIICAFCLLFWRVAAIYLNWCLFMMRINCYRCRLH